MNATVTLPISELDNLRDSLKEKTERIKDLEKTQKQIRFIIVDSIVEHQPVYDNWSQVIKGYVSNNKLVQSVFYENLDDIIVPIRKEEEKRVNEKIRDLELAIEHSEKKHQKVINDLKEKYKNQLQEKDDEITILKGDKVKLKKEELIDKLEAEVKVLNAHIEKLSNRSFWQRVFNR